MLPWRAMGDGWAMGDGAIDGTTDGCFYSSCEAHPFPSAQVAHCYVFVGPQRSCSIRSNAE